MAMREAREEHVHGDGYITHGHPEGEPRGRYLALLALTALGVVYGDIGTWPLYAVRESFHYYHLAPTPANVLGVLSLVFWSLLLVISVKYALFVLRADNRGEGGILALTALVTPVGATRRGGRWVLIMLGLFGTALLYGDGMITPVISVLGAVEGLKVATPFFEPYIIPITIGILIALFLVQSRGTAAVGKIFGPVTLVWFAMLAVLGVAWIVREPRVLLSASPHHAVRFFAANGWHGFLVLGSVFLVVTGGEALYADMGHFGRRPIRLAWFAIVLPALLLNYFGQGALLLRRPEAVENPFFNMAPQWFIYPQVVIATLAAVIASQALISGAFSLTMQAVQLGYLPRVEIRHTSAREMGQIYIPSVNWILLASCIGLTVGFRSSSNIAAAYGVAVTTTMVITTLLLAVVQRERWKWGVVRRGCVQRRLPRRRPVLLGRQHHQDPARRLVPACRRRSRVRVDDHLEEGPAGPGEPPRGEHPAVGLLRQGHDDEPTAAGTRDGGVHVRRPDGDAARAPAQPEALPGAARAGGAPGRRDGRGPAREPGGAGHGGGARARLLPHRRSATASWRSPTCRRPWQGFAPTGWTWLRCGPRSSWGGRR